MDSNNINISPDTSDRSGDDGNDAAESIVNISMQTILQNTDGEPIAATDNDLISTIEIDTVSSEIKHHISRADTLNQPSTSSDTNNSADNDSLYNSAHEIGSTVNSNGFYLPSDNLSFDPHHTSTISPTAQPRVQNHLYHGNNANSYTFNTKESNSHMNDLFFFNGAQQTAGSTGNYRNGSNHLIPPLSHHTSNYNHSGHSNNFYGNGPNYYGNQVSSQRSSTMNGIASPRRHHFNAQQQNSPSYFNVSNSATVNAADPNFFFGNGGTYGNGHQFDYGPCGISTSSNRPLSPHLVNMSSSRNRLPSPQNSTMHYNNTPLGGGRYSQLTSSNNLKNVNNTIIASDFATPDMISVANTCTMPSFSNESVCTQINNILSQSTKDHQAIVMATKSSTNKLLQDHDGGSMHIGDILSGNYTVEKEDVNEILRAAGFDANKLCRPSQLNTNHNYATNHHSNGRFNSYPRHSQVVKSNSHRVFFGESDPTNSASAGVSSSNVMESQSERNSVSNHYTSNRANAYRTNDPYLNSKKTGDFDPNEFEHLHNSIRSGAIDLSISSDEDHRHMEFGPVGSNPRKIHLYQQQQQQLNPAPFLTNIDTPTTVRKRSQNGATSSAAHVSYKANFKNGLTSTTVATAHDTSNRNSGSDVAIRTRSLGDSSDIQNRIDEGVVSAMNALSDLSIDRDFPDVNASFFSSQALLCIHSIMKTFCTICQNDSPPPVPHDSVVTRMSAASTSSYTAPPIYHFHQSSRHSACEFRPQSDSPRARHTQQPHYNNENNHGSGGISKVLSHTNNHSKIDAVGGGVRDVYSRKVFVGGLPQDITETQIAHEFKRFGELVVDWPHKLDSNSGLPPKGYAFLLFERAESVMNLISCCSKVDEKFFWAVSSQRSESKQVQIRPWTITDAVWSSKNPIEKPVPRCKRTVFVGGIPRQAQARELFENMNRCFGGVALVEIDVDLEYSYPKGAASVTFDNNQCYLKALEAHFISLKLCGMEKRVEIKPFFSDDQHCEECGIQMNSRNGGCNSSSANNHQNGGNSTQPMGQYFCVDRECLKYFCENCWSSHQEDFGHMQPQQNKSNGYHRQFQFRRTTNHLNYNNNKSNN